MRRIRGYITLANYKASIASFHLDSVIADAQPTVKPNAWQSQSAAALTSG
jgi:hypothetical protein